MSKSISPFRFKRFAVSHHRSSMKVGVDGVLIACWADIGGAGRILDVGTGCGVIALIMAQRASGAHIYAIDIDAPSIAETRENVAASPWPERIDVRELGFAEASLLLIDEQHCFDLIVSNPPYFDSGITEATSAREKARHQGELSPMSLLKGAKSLLNPGGSVAMVVPTDIAGELEDDAFRLSYVLMRKCLVRGHSGAPYKRVLLQWRLSEQEERYQEVETEYLTLESSPGIPTDDYRRLCGEFYLRF